MLRRGDVFRDPPRGWGEATLRHLVKASPRVEVSLGGIELGTAEPAEWTEQTAVWEHAFRPQEFRPGEALEFKVFDAGSWPRKDALVGIGKLQLSPDVWRQRAGQDGAQLGGQRRAVDQTVVLERPRPGAGPGPCGSLQVHLVFAGLDRERKETKADTGHLGPVRAPGPGKAPAPPESPAPTSASSVEARPAEPPPAAASPRPPSPRSEKVHGGPAAGRAMPAVSLPGVGAAADPGSGLATCTVARL